MFYYDENLYVNDDCVDTLASCCWYFSFVNFFADLLTAGYINHNRVVVANQTRHASEDATHQYFFFFLTNMRAIFSTHNTRRPTFLRRRRAWMFHCISRGKISHNALQIYLIFYALLFLSVAASRMVDGISRIIDRLVFIFRFARERQHEYTRRKRVRI